MVRCKLELPREGQWIFCSSPVFLVPMTNELRNSSFATEQRKHSKLPTVNPQPSWKLPQNHERESQKNQACVISVRQHTVQKIKMFHRNQKDFLYCLYKWFRFGIFHLKSIIQFLFTTETNIQNKSLYFPPTIDIMKMQITTRLLRKSR